MARLRKRFEQFFERALRRLARSWRVIGHVVDARIEIIEIHRGINMLVSIFVQEQGHNFDVFFFDQFLRQRGYGVGNDFDHSAQLLSQRRRAKAQPPYHS